MATLIVGPLLAAKIIGGIGVLGAAAGALRWLVHR
jgi:hypothetical protein